MSSVSKSSLNKKRLCISVVHQEGVGFSDLGKIPLYFRTSPKNLISIQKNLTLILSPIAVLRKNNYVRLLGLFSSGSVSFVWSSTQELER